jgi:hypothetical protein
MQIIWPDKDGKPISAPIAAHLLPYIEAIGLDNAAALFFAMGGAPAYLPATPRDDSEIVRAIGSDNVIKLSKHLGAGHIARVPNDATFLTRYLASQGMSVLAIARKMHCTDVTVRKRLVDPHQFPPERQVSRKRLIRLRSDAR